jgi:DNA-binding winged helix-turn-helix (wHTH) protein
MLAHLKTREARTGVVVSGLLAALIASVAWTAVHIVLCRQAQAYRDRCVVYASSISETVPLLGLPATQGPTSLAGYAAIAGFVYLQVMWGDEVLVNFAAFPGAKAILAEPCSLPPHATLRRTGGRDIADILVPYNVTASVGGTAGTAYPIGRLRIGVDASSLAWAAANTKALAAGLAALSWAAATALAGLLACRTMRVARPTEGAEAHDARTGRVVRAGSLVLHIDEARLVVGGRSVRLTPKQLQLLRVLLSDPGRAFTDEEILAQAWPAPSYADSKDVKQCVYLIRQRMSAAGVTADRVLVNVPGIGYRIVPPDEGDTPVAVVDPMKVESRPRPGAGCRTERGRMP